MNNDKTRLNCILEIDTTTLANIKDKFSFIECIAEFLFKKDMYMTVPTLVALLNDFGHKTDYGSEYAGERGSYRLVRAAYDRMAEKHGEYFANKLAGVFRTPDNRYAYEVD